ncbi:VOC family protein [Micromonospora soli]|uniref:VOC family protein n=1 Tax=Micromonospora sp. NBRC 110009 TaxID=3061627 RepID=UPI0026710CDC|nr:VOC family protein [Micromonospora sp. NBRC 110009]WKT96777.1 VOC family protein [Micromonospora sp. NBRC 110009]
MIARFKDLCMDAADAHRLGEFWAGILNGELVDTGGGDTRVDPRAAASRAESIWVNTVPEPRAGKTRVHLDLRLAEPEPTGLLAAGARLVREPDAEISWWVLADPEGNQFCAFRPRPGARPGVFELVVESADPLAQATWWAGVVGGRVETTAEDAAAVVGADGFPWDRWVFDPTPERKRVKNRVHWDVDLAGRDGTALVAAGATLLTEPTEASPWWVLADPEGNEFCAFPPRDR